MLGPGARASLPLALVQSGAGEEVTALAIQGAARPSLGWLNVLVFLFFWNAMKFAWMAVLSFPLRLGRALARWFRRQGVASAG
ncbi:hypothetical protein GCM10023350_29520 [Nocardioides endophyticus]|uniref:Uncharacterized protein n=1 Tax=Nocardioides endophyticus TaxID=1353775 RepID=A0ABP8Z0L5_9ACTN